MSNATVGSVHTLSKTKIAVAITTAAALIAAPVLLQGSIAHAATVNVGADAVEPIEIGGMDPATLPADYNYDEWHIGTTGITAEQGATLFNFDNPAGITLLPNTHSGSSTQLLKGNHISNINAGTYDMTHTEFAEFLEGLSINVVSGSVHLQIAGQYLWNEGTASDPDYDPEWTTFRPVVAHGTATASALTDWTDSSGWFWSTPGTMDDVLSEMEEYDDLFRLFGVGVVTDDGAVVSSITFGGNLYNFAAAPTPGVVDTAAPAAADYTALITALAIFAGLGLAIGAVVVRRKVQA